MNAPGEICLIGIWNSKKALLLLLLCLTLSTIRTRANARTLTHMRATRAHAAKLTYQARLPDITICPNNGWKLDALSDPRTSNYSTAR